VDEEFICRQLLRRAPQGPLSTARHEPDQVEVLSGVYQGVTTGMPVCLLLRNRDVRSADYDALRHTPRPSHADYTAWVQSGGRNDPRGGGAFSGRLTAPLVAAGALAKSWLKLQDIKVNAQVIDENALRQRAEEARQEGLDVLILGCTHYPLLTDIIREIMGPEVSLVNAGAESVHTLHDALARRQLLAPEGAGQALLCTSDRPEGFGQMARRFLQEEPTAPVRLVDIERY